MIYKILVSILALSFTTQTLAALDNPFNKTNEVYVGAEIEWGITDGVASKTAESADNDDTYYQLSVSNKQLSLRLLSDDSGRAEAAISFEQLTINDVQFDGVSSKLFKWCLNNQQRHSRFLQQGLSVKKEICQNRGKQGLFVMSLNQSTYDILKKTKIITFTIKPYRGAVEVTFEVPKIAKVLAKLNRGQKPAFASKKPVPVRAAVVAPAVVPKAKKICKMKPPSGFKSVKAVDYECDNEAAKTSARTEIAAKVKKAKSIAKAKKDLALKRQQKQKQSEAEKQKLAAEKEREAVAILANEAKASRLRDQVSKKMIGMCNKQWSQGEHRCYCEPYISFAPAGIESDASCAGS